MDGKKNKGTKVTLDSRKDAVRENGTDMSKYSRAVSDKSRVDYSALKLVHIESSESRESSDRGGKKPSAAKKHSERGKASAGSNGGKNRSGADSRSTGSVGKHAKDNHARQNRHETPRSDDKQNGHKNNTGGAKGNNVLTLVGAEKEKNAKTPSSSAGTAEERYSNALESGDHYSSAVEKYYMKYPNAKRARKAASSAKSDETRKKKRRSAGSAGGGTNGKGKKSIAEIAVKNKSNSGVRERAKSARDARAKGTVSPRVANRSFHRRRKKRSGALNVLVVSAIAAVIVIVCVSVFFNIKRIEIEGEHPYSEEEIRKKCTFASGNNILFIDTEGVEKRIEKELPYIAECSVERKIPSVVVISVTQAEPIGVVAMTDSKWSVVSDAGKILETVTNAKGADAKGVRTETKYTSVYDFAQEKKLPVLEEMDLRNRVEDGFITDDQIIEHLQVFKLIKDSFRDVNMALTSVKYGQRGYEGSYEGRIAVIFGKEPEKKYIRHYMDEVQYLIVNEHKIESDAKGEIRLYKNKVFFRPIYEQSEEELQKIDEKRREKNRASLMTFASYFLAAGHDWLQGKLQTE